MAPRHPLGDPTSGYLRCYVRRSLYNIEMDRGTVGPEEETLSRTVPGLHMDVPLLSTYPVDKA